MSCSIRECRRWIPPRTFLSLVAQINEISEAHRGVALFAAVRGSGFFSAPRWRFAFSRITWIGPRQLVTRDSQQIRIQCKKVLMPNPTHMRDACG